jgi:hypothetical protein
MPLRRPLASLLALSLLGACGSTVIRRAPDDAAADDRAPPGPDATLDDGGGPPLDAVLPPVDAVMPRGDAIAPPRDTAPPPADRLVVLDALPPRDAGGEVLAGARCDDDSQCGSLTCAFANEPFCTGPCGPSSATTPEARDREESSVCGAGGTCINLGAGGGAEGGICIASCQTGIVAGAPGSCRAGYVCTGQWLRQPGGVPDDPGCFPFCSEDSQCEAGGRCNGRTGQCDSDGVVPGRLPDGSPCDPTRTELRPGEETPRNVQCRGVCFQVGSAERSQGLCGSILDLARTPRCPDEPDRMQPLAPSAGDDQAVCVFRSCTTNADCAGPLRCVLPERGGVPDPAGARRCSYPTRAQPDGTSDAGVPRDA